MDRLFPWRTHVALEAMWISPAAKEGCVPAVGGFKPTAARQCCCPVVLGGCRLPASRQEPQHCKKNSRITVTTSRGDA